MNREDAVEEGLRAARWIANPREVLYKFCMADWKTEAQTDNIAVLHLKSQGGSPASMAVFAANVKDGVRMFPCGHFCYTSICYKSRYCCLCDPNPKRPICDLHLKA